MDQPNDLQMGSAILALLDARDRDCTTVATWLLNLVCARHAAQAREMLEARMSGATVAEITKMFRR